MYTTIHRLFFTGMAGTLLAVITGGTERAGGDRFD
jgi:hypothetical protein